MTDRSSKRQRELLSFVDSFIKGNGYGPSYREIMRALGYKSVSTVAIHIDNLISKGYLIKRNHSARSLEVVSTDIKADTRPASPEQAEHRKWLAKLVMDNLNNVDKLTPGEIDNCKILIESLKLLGFEQEHKKAQSKLDSLLADGDKV